MYADVIVDIESEELNRTFQYAIPKELEVEVTLGSTVEIPFGKRQIKGYVLSLSLEPAIEKDRIKEIISVITNKGIVESDLVKLATWMSKSYGTTLASSLKVVFPVKKKIQKKQATFLHLEGDESFWQSEREFFLKKHQVARLRLLDELIREEHIPKSLVTEKLNVSQPVIKALVERGLVSEDTRRIYRNPLEEGKEKKQGHILNADQQSVVDNIIAGSGSDKGRVSLIKGVTGSGKTEVYIELCDKIIKNGKQAIVLIPEIALTFQTVMRFYNRFGDRVSTMHSRLSDGERYDQFERAKRGEIDVMVGPRSALFTPFSNLGIIIIDEEHEGSYKSEKTPKYHARETAIERARLQDAIVVLGSATPSVDAYYRAKQGEYRLYELSKRATGARLAKTEIVDMRQELLAGNKSPFSRVLHEKINDRLTKKEQVMLFLNRRGYAGFISCRKCGFVYKCPHCDVSLSGHRNGKLVCHYCGYEEVFTKTCKKCGSKYVGVMKAGTEAIEKAAREAFPAATILRMDMDTTSGKDGHKKILSAFANKEADILIGTQMIVKGHDFPDVTLVGALAADMSLFAGDYRAGERTFQLLTQAAGRAGRGDKEGEVIIQTYSPENEHIIAAASQNYDRFYEYEKMYRELLSYPPAGHMAAVLVESKSLERATLVAEGIAKKAALFGDAIFEKERKSVSVIGPAPASVAYIKDIFRQVLYLKSKDLSVLERAIACIDDINNGEDCKKGEYTISYDMDPVSGY